MNRHAQKRADLPGPPADMSEENAYSPRTRLGELLLAARREYLRSGNPLLDEDGLEREITERRGERNRD